MKTVGNFFFSITAPLLLLLFSGCATTVDLSKFKDADLKEAEMMPSKNQLKQERIKIIVFEADATGLAKAARAQLGATLAKSIESQLSVVGTEVVDRNLAIKLKDELRLAESMGKGSYSGPAVAQYAISSKLTGADYTISFVPESSWKDDKGVVHVTPASYNHIAAVSGTVGVYELPALRLVTSFNVSGSSMLNDPYNHVNLSTQDNLLRVATNSAIGKQQVLKNYFAPKGYVVERRTDGKKSIFKILLGLEQGAKQEDKAVIYDIRKKTNLLTGIEQIDERPIAEARVSDQITSTESWIVPEDQEAAANIRLGNVVKVKY